MLTWNKENLWNYHISLCTGERLKIVISCHLTISLRTHSCNETLSRISHIQLQHWKLWQQHNAHIDSSTLHISSVLYCRWYRSMLPPLHGGVRFHWEFSKTQISWEVFGSIGNFPKHRWQKTALRFHVDRKTLLFFSLQTYLIFFRNARNAVSVKFLAECKKNPEQTRKLLLWAPFVVNLRTFRV